MDGSIELKERVKRAYYITGHATEVDQVDIGKIEAVIYTMANKFLDQVDMQDIKESMAMTKIGKILFEDGISQGKVEDLKNLMKNMGWTAEAALKALSIPEQNWDYFMKQL